MYDISFFCLFPKVICLYFEHLNGISIPQCYKHYKRVRAIGFLKTNFFLEFLMNKGDIFPPKEYNYRSSCLPVLYVIPNIKLIFSIKMFFYYSKATLNGFPNTFASLYDCRSLNSLVSSPMEAGGRVEWHVAPWYTAHGPMHAVPPGTSVHLVQITFSFSEDLYIWEEGHFCVSACFDGALCRPGIYERGWRRGLCWPLSTLLAKC